MLARYDLELDAHMVGPPPNDAAPERDKLIAYTRRDAQILVNQYDLKFVDAGAQPSALTLYWATARFVKPFKQRALHQARRPFVGLLVVC